MAFPNLDTPIPPCNPVAAAARARMSEGSPAMPFDAAEPGHEKIVHALTLLAAAFKARGVDELTIVSAVTNMTWPEVGLISPREAVKIVEHVLR